MDAFGVFQGGGLKGFAHVGALQAADEKGVRFRGLAGTSAGAIVAALAAVGYTGKELLDTLNEAQPGLLAFKLDAVLASGELHSAGRFAAPGESLLSRGTPLSNALAEPWRRGGWHSR